MPDNKPHTSKQELVGTTSEPAGCDGICGRCEEGGGGEEEKDRQWSLDHF